MTRFCQKNSYAFKMPINTEDLRFFAEDELVTIEPFFKEGALILSGVSFFLCNIYIYLFKIKLSNSIKYQLSVKFTYL